MTDVGSLDDLARKIASGLFPNVARYARAQAAATQAQELEIRKLREEIDVLKGSGTGTRPPVAKPVNTVVPAITGPATVGATLAASTGTWNGSPTAFAYQWARGANESAVFADIPAATGSSYVLTSADQGLVLRVRVTAQNAGGETAAVSGVTATVSGGTSTQFGTSLPPRIPVSTGSVINVTTTGQLQTQMASCPIGSIIDGGGNTFDVGSAINLTWNRDGNGTTTTLRNCVFTDTRVLVLYPGSYFRIEDCTFTDAPFNGVKFEGGHHVEVVGCTITRVLDTNGGSGILAAQLGTNNSHHWQIWDCEIRQAGFNSTVPQFGHGIYASRADPTCVIANTLLVDMNAFGIQIYPAPIDGLIVTCCTIVRSDNRGGFVVSDDAVNCKLVGPLIVDSKVGVGEIMSPLSNNNRLYGCVEWSSDGSGTNVANLAPVNHVTTNPVIDANFVPDSSGSARNLIPQSAWGYVPPLDKDGNARVTADAGCFATV